MQPSPKPDLTRVKRMAGILAIVSGVFFGLVALVLFRFDPAIAAFITTLDIMIGITMLYTSRRPHKTLQGR